MPAALDGAELGVDAIFGAGLSGALEGGPAQTLAAAAARKVMIVAVDVPSGSMGDTGANVGAVACARHRDVLLQEAGSICCSRAVACAAG